MKRSAAMGVGVVALGVLAACTRERVIIVHDPAPTPSESATSGADPTANDPVAPPDTPAVAMNDGDPGPNGTVWGIVERNVSAEYAETIAKVTQMPRDSELRSRVQRRKLSVVNVTWEDTGRAQSSAVGPNISDLTLQVRRRDEQNRWRASLLPVIRHPNFTDKTGDVAADKFFVRVGNQAGSADLTSVRLTDVLRNIKAFSTAADSVLGDGNLLAGRDSHFLVSSQAVFLPIPKEGKAEFNPVLFNYQSSPGSPAVLTLLVTRQGTSIRVIENRREDGSAASGFGQELYFNNRGQRAAFTAERKTDVATRIAAQGGPKNEDERTSLQRGADVLFLVQVPLVHANRGRLGGAVPTTKADGTAEEDKKEWAAPKGAGLSGLAGGAAPSSGAGASAGGMPSKKPSPSAARRASDEPSDMEQAVLGHGPNLGPYREGTSARLVRDTRFPVRITVQFYKATSNGSVSDTDLDSIAKNIGSVYEHADFVGSLVMPDGDPKRPTAWQKVPHEWFPW